jgi:3-oxoacyl-[acyl-carrier-protein] synthase-3
VTIVDGSAVFAKAVAMMARCSTEALAAAALKPDAVTRFVPHQANARLFNAVAGQVGIEGGRVIATIADYGIVGGHDSAVIVPGSPSRAAAAG